MTRFSLHRFTGLLPLILLLIALSTVFLFGNDRGYFYRSWLHNALTSNYLVVTANLSYKHNFLGFHRQTLDANGTRSYDPYNRFPIGGYALIKLAILPFDGNLSAQIYAARMLMLLFFVAIGVLAYLSLCRLTSNRWIALTATLLSLSSYYCLYYNDMVATEACPDLFGVLLVFHGMVIFVQKGRFRQLLVKTCLALLLGWHVFALLLPFIVLGLANEFIKVRPACSARLSYPIVLCLSLLRSRYLVLGVFALFFGMAVLSFNFANEYFALKGERPLVNLPSFRSFLYRTGQNESFNTLYAERLAWLPFLKSQFSRIGVASLPYFIAPEGLPGITFGIFIFSACLIGLMFVRHKILLATLALFGFCWSLPMRHTTAFHSFEGLFYIGIPLVLYSIVFYYIHRLSSNRLIVYLSVTSLLIFVLGSFYMSRVGDDAEATEFHKAMIADFEAIRKITKGKKIFVPQSTFDHEFSGARQSTAYYLAGSIILFYNDKHKVGLADFVITRGREEKTGLLTPENRLVFLYDNTSLIDEYRSEYRSVTSNEPVVRSNFDIFMRKRTLYYVRPRCISPNPRERFFLYIVPVNKNDLPQDRKQDGFDIRRTKFWKNGRIFDGKCMVTVALPQYKIASIRTGSTIGNSTDEVWAEEFSLSE